MKMPIYLDHNATTPVDPRVFEAMRPYFCEKFGNAASRTHRYGWEAEEAVEKARAQIASLIHAPSSQTILFTSGATETNNTVLKGVLHANKQKGDHVVTQKTEHKCVLDSAKELEKEGFRVTYLPVDRFGGVDPDDVRRAIEPKTVLLSIMYANNEIGTIQPIREIGAVAREKGVLFHCDAVQAVGHVPVDVEADGIDLMSISAHKMYGPKGVAALYFASRRPPIRMTPLMHGGGHERGKRSGTLNVTGIVGLGAASAIAERELDEHAGRARVLREKLREGLFRSLDHIHLNGHPTERLPGNLNVSFEYIEGEALIMGMPDIAIASGSACTSSSLEPSYVIRALGMSEELAHSSIRFGLGRSTTAEEIDFVIECVTRTVKRLREMSPLYEMVQKGIDVSKIQWRATSL